MNRSLSDAPYDDAELAAAIDASFGDGPTPPSLDGLLLAGRRARRRRTTTRVALGGAVAAGVLAAVGASTGGWDLTGAAGSDTGVATTPSTAPADPTPAEPAPESFDLSFTRDGAPRAGAGTEILRRVDDPLVKPADQRSYALALRADGEEWWVLAEWSRAGVLVSSDEAGLDAQGWETWLDAKVRSAGGWDYTSEAAPPLVELTADGDLTAGLGAEVTVERLDVDLGSRFAAPGDDTAAAEVEADGNRWYVVARSIEGGPGEVIVVDPRDAEPPFDGFDEFVAWAAGKYGEGPTAGLR